MNKIITSKEQDWREDLEKHLDNGWEITSENAESERVIYILSKPKDEGAKEPLVQEPKSSICLCGHGKNYHKEGKGGCCNTSGYPDYDQCECQSFVASS